jgi:hypothetical protein
VEDAGMGSHQTVVQLNVTSQSAADADVDLRVTTTVLQHTEQTASSVRESLMDLLTTNNFTDVNVHTTKMAVIADADGHSGSYGTVVGVVLASFAVLLILVVIVLYLLWCRSRFQGSRSQLDDKSVSQAEQGCVVDVEESQREDTVMSPLSHSTANLDEEKHTTCKTIKDDKLLGEKLSAIILPKNLAIAQYQEPFATCVPFIDRLPVRLRDRILEIAALKLCVTSMKDFLTADTPRSAFGKKEHSVSNKEWNEMLKSGIYARMELAKVQQQWCHSLSSNESIKRLKSCINGTFCWYRGHPEQLTTLSPNSSVDGIAYLNNKVYLLCSKSKEIRIFLTNEKHTVYVDHLTVSIKKLKSFMDIVAWNGSIFVADLEGNCVFQLSTNNDQVDLREWVKSKQDGKPIKPCTLSVAVKNLAIVTYDKELLIYGTDGKEMKCISIDNNIDPFYAITSLFDGKLIASLRLQQDYTDSQKAENVQQKRFYKHRLHAAFDARGWCFFTDYSNACVFLKGCDMRKYRLLLKGGSSELRDPKKLCYANDSGHLFVSDQNIVRVYHVLMC